MIKVKNRHGKLEEFDISKIQKNTSKAVKGLNYVSQSELEAEAHLIFVNEMTTREIQNTLIKTAFEKIDIDRPDWTYVAARLFLYDLYHEVGIALGNEKGNPYGKLLKYIEHGEQAGKFILGLKEKFDLDELDKEIDPERDMLFTYLGIRTLYDRYILKDKEGDPFELPQHLFMGVSMFVAQNETNPLSMDIDARKEYDKVEGGEAQKRFVRTYWAKKFYGILSKFEVMAATPTLSNARTPRHQLSSCYIGSTPDNIEGIFEAYKEQALLSKFGGGIGWDWNQIRGLKSSIDNTKGAAGGVIPFLKIENDVALAVDQLGTRKGAIAVYMEPWHIDIRDFLDLKKNAGEERRRAHDLFPAVWINDLFMERVENDQAWTLFSPEHVPELSETHGQAFRELYEKYEEDDSIPKEMISAKLLWKQMLKEYFETGNPFLTFKDRANAVNPNKHDGIIRSSNLCTEIFQNTAPSKYLVEVEYKDEKTGESVFETFEEAEIIITDTGVTKPAKKITTIDTINGRTPYFVGKRQVEGDTAVCNLASINLSKINTKEDIERVTPIAIRFLDNVIDLNFYPSRKTKVTNEKTRAVGLGMMGEAQMLAEAKIIYGSQEHFNKIDEIMEMISYNAIKSSAELGAEKGSYPIFEGSDWSKGIFPIDKIKDEVLELTTREGRVYDWEALKGITSKSMRNGYLMAVAPTSSISILTGTSQANEPIYKRKWYEENLSGLIPVCAPNLSPETWAYYPSAYDLDQRVLVRAGAVRQKWIDQGQSLNIFMSLDKVSGKVLNDVYMDAWKFGLKSTYYLRSESPEAKEEPEAVDRSQECVGCQ